MSWHNEIKNTDKSIGGKATLAEWLGNHVQ